MAANFPFALSKATKDDLPELTALQYKCFTPFIRRVFMGCNTEADLPRLVESFEETMKTDAHDIWIKVVDIKTGKIAAGSNWKVYPNAHGPSDDQPLEWLDEQVKKQAQAILDEWTALRKAANPEGHVHLHICFTDPDYRRQGAGALMMQWGCALADQLFVPSWIEASPEGNFLYQRYGFYNIKEASGHAAELDGEIVMRRDAKTSHILGGRGVSMPGSSK